MVIEVIVIVGIVVLILYMFMYEPLTHPVESELPPKSTGTGLKIKTRIVGTHASSGKVILALKRFLATSCNIPVDDISLTHNAQTGVVDGNIVPKDGYLECIESYKDLESIDRDMDIRIERTDWCDNFHYYSK
jgi:hypothetical protein